MSEAQQFVLEPPLRKRIFYCYIYDISVFMLLAVVVVILQYIQYLSVVHLHMYLAMCSEDESLELLVEREIRGRVINNKINIINVEGSGRHLYPNTKKRLRQYIQCAS
jgi:hypothetical protein